MENDNKLDSWDDFTGTNFLKGEDVKSDEDAFVCTKVEVSVNQQGTKRPRLELENNGKIFIMDLNITNSKELETLKIASPRAMLSKIIYFKKVLVRNPQTNKEVEGLRILKIV